MTTGVMKTGLLLFPPEEWEESAPGVWEQEPASTPSWTSSLGPKLSRSQGVVASLFSLVAVCRLGYY